MYFNVRNIEPGDPRLDEFLDHLAEPTLKSDLWEDAEHVILPELIPNRVWTVVEVRENARFVPVAWAASYEIDVEGIRTLRCSDNYERRGVGRDYGLYRVAYRHRHRTVVLPSGLPGLTYLYEQPIALHEADGWVRTGYCGTSREAKEPHDWWELRRAV